MTTQLARFVIVGCFATAVHWLTVFWAENWFSTLHLNVSNVIGFLLAFPVSYLGQRWYTFHSRVGHAQAAWRYLTSQLIGLGLNSLVVFVLVVTFDQERLLFVIVGTAAAAVAVFLLSRFWVFGVEQQRRFDR